MPLGPTAQAVPLNGFHPMPELRSKRRALACLAALLAAVALGFWLRQDILARSAREMTWVIGRPGGASRGLTISGSGTTMNSVPFFGGRIIKFQDGAMPSATGETHGWLLICRWFYVGRHDTAVSIR